MIQTFKLQFWKWHLNPISWLGWPVPAPLYAIFLMLLSKTGEIIKSGEICSPISQRWKVKLSVPGLYKNTIPTPLGLPWLSSYPKISAEDNYLGLIEQMIPQKQ